MKAEQTDLFAATAPAAAAAAAPAASEPSVATGIPAAPAALSFTDAPGFAGALPRDLILASAGSGKTFRISSAIITLLARGGRPDEVLASTFTRKAAGEILDRVLVRLAGAALSEEKAAELAVHAGPTSHDGKRIHCDSAFWTNVLERVVRDLHRMNIGTLDAFFLGRFVVI